MGIYSIYRIVMLALIITWQIVNSFPTLYVYYYPESDNTLKETLTVKEEAHKKFENKITTFFLVCVLVLIGYLYLQTDLLVIRYIVFFILFLFQLLITIQISIIVVNTILGVKKQYFYFSAQHNAMKYLSSIFGILLLATEPQNSILNFNIIALNSDLLNDFLVSFFYLSINLVFIFFFLTISLFFIQDILIYLVEKKWYKNKENKKINRHSIMNKKIKVFKEDIWEKYSFTEIKVGKILHAIYYFFAIIVEYLLGMFYFFINYSMMIFRTLYFFIKRVCKNIVALSVDYIIAVSARISAILAISITFVLFKYSSIISTEGMDVLEFVFTIFLLPIIFSEISRYRRNEIEKSK